MAKFQVYKDSAGEWRWRLRANNNEVIAQGEGYKQKDSCLHCVELIKSLARDAEVEEV